MAAAGAQLKFSSIEHIWHFAKIYNFAVRIRTDNGAAAAAAADAAMQLAVGGAWGMADGAIVKREQRKLLNFKKVVGGMPYLTNEWPKIHRQLFPKWLRAKFEGQKIEKVLLATGNAQLWHQLSRKKVDWVNNPQRWLALEKLRYDLGGLDLRDDDATDRFVFTSKSKNAAPGRGANEHVANPEHYLQLASIPNWRRVLSNFYMPPEGITVRMEDLVWAPAFRAARAAFQYRF